MEQREFTVTSRIVVSYFNSILPEIRNHETFQGKKLIFSILLKILI
jgi:hypothetical protein